MYRALTVAGSDSGGGAGIQADIKTFAANGVYGLSAITAVTSQNTTGIYDVLPIPASIVLSQMEAVLSDIGADAVKIGMLYSAKTAEAVAKVLTKYNCTNTVLDPVMVSTSGRRLADDGCIDTIKTELLPIVSLVTPNLDEAQILSGMNICTTDDMCEACRLIASCGPDAVLVKGGHMPGSTSADVLYSKGEFYWFESPRIKSRCTHGTGCTLSSAIASGLAKGMEMVDSVSAAKKYLTLSIYNAVMVGHGNGPLNHFFGAKIFEVEKRHDK